MKILIVVLLFCSLVSAKEKTDELELKYDELKVLKLFLDNTRDSLDGEMKKRWEAKERYIEQKKMDKEELADHRSRLEKLYGDQSRIKEECLLFEGKVEDQKEKLEKMKKEQEYVSLSIKEQLEKVTKNIVNHFPLSIEQEKLAVNEIQREYLVDKKDSKAIASLTAFQKERFLKYSQIALTKTTVLSDDNKQHNMNIVRIGEVTAYGINNSGDVYIIRQTGNLGSARYAIDNISSIKYKTAVQTALKDWIKELKINGSVPFEIMQSANSKKLITGEKISKLTKFYQWFNKGGAVMWAMSAIVIWTILLIFAKIIQFSHTHKDARKLRKDIVNILENENKEVALEYVQDKKGVVARSVKACLQHSKWKRSSAEKAVREILIEEVPQLNKNLTTLAVLASSAPMLGLLGTVTGMIHLFKVITQYGTSDPGILAGGISEALITTQAGLIVAIPLLLVHNFLKNKAKFIQTEVERNTIKVLNRLWPEG